MKGRMSSEGRQFKKPSQQEIYRDAARIVEELLYARLDQNGLGDLHGNFARSNSYQAASTENVISEEVPDVDECNDDDEHLVRSQTAPSRFKWDFKGKDKKAKKSRSRLGSKSKKTQDGDNKQLNVEIPLPPHPERSRAGSKSKKLQDGEVQSSLPRPYSVRTGSELAKGDNGSSDKPSHHNTDVERKSSMSQKKKSGVDVNGYCSSSESDGEGKMKKSSTLRRKKSFFKKAKERLMSTFHRDEKSDDDDLYIHGPEKEKKKKRWKHKKDRHIENKSGGDVSANATVHADLDLNVKDTADGNDHPPEHDISLRRNSAGKRFLSSVRKSFRMKKKSDLPESQSADHVSTKGEKDYSRSSSTPNDHTGLLNLPVTEGGGSDRTGLLHLPVAQCGGSDERKSSFTRRREQAAQFIGFGPGQSKKSPAPISETDETCVKTDDELWEKSGSGYADESQHSDLPQVSIETDGNHDASDGKSPNDDSKTDDQDIPYDQKTESEKEDVIAKVVQKLIEIGDNIAVQSHSDTDSRSRLSAQTQPDTSGASAPGDDALSSLEREILMCLRSGGDRLSETMDDPTTGLVQEAKQTVYDQFSQTIRRTVGDEVNWHQMALVFHASRTALNVVGIGTDKARRLKDLTVKYVTDKCASFIYEQGGWESVVSEDSDLD